MNLYGIHYEYRNIPKLDPGFCPIGVWEKAFLNTADTPLSLAVERSDGQIAAVHTKIHSPAGEADFYYAGRLVKTMLWMKGGCKVHVAGDKAVYDYLKQAFAPGGRQEFDASYLSRVFDAPFEVVYGDTVPEEKNFPQLLGGHLDGCRIGFDAGGSDRKVSAVQDGKTVYSEEVVWFPKTNEDPDYHYQGITEALRTAAAHLPRVDGVGISSAGIYINNHTMGASLFVKVPQDLFDSKVRDIYIRAVTDTFGDIPFSVANDGDVSALAGMMSLGEGNVLGIAMGTSEAVGFVDAENRITGWLNELAFVPVDCSPEAGWDDWQQDIGCGVQYFSQDAVIRLAPRAGIELPEELSPAEKLKFVQARLDTPAAQDVFTTIGTCLGHTLAHYHTLYGCRHVLLLGRVTSGLGGELILNEAKRVLADEYPGLPVLPALPDEKFRRVGQSAAAASLPQLR